MGGENSSGGGGGGGGDGGGGGGNDIELVSLRNARLFLVDQEETVPMQRGEFRLILTKQLHSPLAAVVAIVKDVEWPVGKDSAVLKLGRGCYTFCLPGFAYGLVVDNSAAATDASFPTTAAALEQLELFLGKYCTYEDRSSHGVARFLPDRADESVAVEFWNNVAARGMISADTDVSSSKPAAAPFFFGSRQQHQQQHKDASTTSPSPRMMKRIQGARRLSAIAKLFSRALLKGAISNLKHVNSKGMPDHEAVASVDAFAKVVEAVEALSRSGGSSSKLDQQQQHDQQQQQQPPQKKTRSLIETSWTLNSIGLELLIGAVAASTALSLSSSVRPPSSTSYAAQQPQQRPPLPVSSHFLDQPGRHSLRPVPPQQSHHQRD